jgi:hypothetical protein
MTTEAMTWVGAVGIVTIVAGVAFAANRWANQVDQATDAAAGILEQFNSAANALLDDERTPMPIAEFVVMLSREIANPRIADWFIEHGGSFQEPARPNAHLRALAKLPPELAAKYVIAVITALFASASEHKDAAHWRNLVAERLNTIVATSSAQTVDPAPAIELKPNDGAVIVVRETQAVPEPMQRAVAEYIHMRPFPQPRQAVAA